jgi:superfamily II DNA/RNA helicase
MRTTENKEDTEKYFLCSVYFLLLIALRRGFTIAYLFVLCYNKDMYNAFEALNVEERLARRLADRGIMNPSAVQIAVAPPIHSGLDVMFRSATGTGKTLAYLLPLVANLNPDAENGPAILILAPTSELAAQISSEIQFISAPTAPSSPKLINVVLLSGQGNEKKQIIALRRHKPNIIVGTLSRVLHLASTHSLHLANLNTIVFDEVDRFLAPESTDSLEEFSRIVANRQAPLRQLVACSATLERKVAEHIASLFGHNPETLRLIAVDDNDLLRERIAHWALWCPKREITKTLRSFLAATHYRKTLVFASRSQDVEKIAALLQHHHIKAAPLYSGMERRARNTALADFTSGSATTLVASDLAARGLDIANIKYVVTLDTPRDSEIYIHRAGRTARAGRKGIVVSIGDETDLRNLLAIEKRLHIVITPKVLYNGCIYNTGVFTEVSNENSAA